MKIIKEAWDGVPKLIKGIILLILLVIGFIFILPFWGKLQTLINKYLKPEDKTAPEAQSVEAIETHEEAAKDPKNGGITLSASELVDIANNLHSTLKTYVITTGTASRIGSEIGKAKTSADLHAIFAVYGIRVHSVNPSIIKKVMPWLLLINESNANLNLGEALKTRTADLTKPINANFVKRKIKFQF